MSCLQLGSQNDTDRYYAMLSLRGCGVRACPGLRIAVKRAGHSQIAVCCCGRAALAGRYGRMNTLIEAMQCNSPRNHIWLLQLETAFITIGAPDATTTLLQLWERLPDGVNARLINDEYLPYLGCIKRSHGSQCARCPVYAYP